MKTIRAIVLAGAAFVLLYKFKMSPLAIIAIMAVVGLLWHDPADRAREKAADNPAEETAAQ